MVEALVARDVARWGEEERAGLVARHNKKSAKLVKCEYLEMIGDIAGADAVQATMATARKVASGACDDGVS
jgi:hypothetical protein